jgi:erythromycin esterase
MLNKIIIWFCIIILFACKVDNQEVGIRFLKVSNDDYLEAIGSLVKDKKIVVLGEQDHGGGSVITTKTELIKYLHENHDFDILIFESDFFSLMKNPDEVHSLNNVLKVWSECEQFNKIKDYHKSNFQSENPLLIMGIDNTHFTDFRKNNLVEYFETINSLINVDKSDFDKFLSVVKKFERSGIFVKLTKDELRKLEWLSDILKTQSNFEARLANQELSNLISVYENAKNLWSNNLSSPPLKSPFESGSLITD